MADSAVEPVKSGPVNSSVGPLMGREKARSRWITVEPVIILGMVGYTCIILLKPLYVKDAIRLSHNVTETNATVNCSTGSDLLDDEIQSEASLWLLYLGAASAIPAIFSNIIFSTLSDACGRKIAMVLPTVGFAAQAGVYALVVYFKLPLPFLFVGDVLQGVTGGFGLLFAGCISYIIDTTSTEQRTLKIVIAEMLSFLMGGINEIGQGYLIRFGYLPPLMISLGCQTLALLYTVVPPCLIETVDRSRSDEEGKGFRDVARRMKMLLVFNENGRRWQMLLLYLVIFFCISQQYGVYSIFILYGTAQPFCWSSSTAGIAASLAFIVPSAGMLIGTKLFSFCLGEYWIMIISCVSLGASSLVIGLAQSTLVIFIGTSLKCLQGITIPVARSVLSKISHPDETGAMFSIVGSLESFSSFVSVLVATSMYAASVSFLPALTFYVFAGATLIPIGIIVALQIFWPRNKEYVPLSTMAINAE